MEHRDGGGYGKAWKNRTRAKWGRRRLKNGDGGGYGRAWKNGDSKGWKINRYGGDWKMDEEEIILASYR